jgi:hypothetical protein
MKSLVLAFVSLIVVTGCSSYPGTDGRTYHWITPIDSDAQYSTTTKGVSVRNVTVNGVGYQIISPK